MHGTCQKVGMAVVRSPEVISISGAQRHVGNYSSNTVSRSWQIISLEAGQSEMKRGSLQSSPC